MENQKTKPSSSDDIDLTQFFRWIGRGLARTGNSILYSIAAMRNLFFSNRLFFFGVILLGLGFGTLYYLLLSKKFYKTTMVLSCDYLNTQILKNMIQKLNLLCGESERDGLAETLKIDLSIAKNIQKFDFIPFVSEDDVVEMEVLREQLNNVASEKKEVVDKVMRRLTIDNKNAYEISAMVYDPDVVKPLEKALVNYFKENEYIKRRIHIHKASLINRKQKLESESRKLDSLKSILYQNYQMLGKTSRGSNNVIMGDDKLANPLEVFREDLTVNQEILSIDHDLYIQPDFEVVEGFTTFKEPESFGLTKILFISFWISLVMGYLIIGVWKFDRLLATYSNE